MNASPGGQAGERTPARVLPNGDPSAAAMVVAESFSQRPLPLGLGGAMSLLGGDQHARRRLILDLGFHWQRQLHEAVGRAVARAAQDDSPWLTVPALMLCGPDGVGRTHVARRLAWLAGLPHVGLDLSAPESIEQLRPSARGPDLMLPALPVLAMAAARCANPVISVYGVEQLDAPAQAEFARMIDPETAGRWVDYASGATVDLRQISWMVQVHDPGRLGAHLPRLLEVIELEWPEPHDLSLHYAEVIAEAALDLGVIDRIERGVDDALQHLSRQWGPRSTGSLYAAAQQWLRTHFA